jgi:hypothetical protein
MTRQEELLLRVGYFFGGSRHHLFNARLTPVILTEFTNFIVVAKVAMVALFPNVASVGIEERVITAAVRELDTGVASLRHDGLGLKEWFQCEHCEADRTESL